MPVDSSKARKLEKREKNGILSMLGRPGAKDGVVEVNLDDPYQLKPLLSAHVHLIDIHSDSDVMSEAPEDTYAGITAEFCTLNFALHKKDPSSGELDKIFWIGLVFFCLLHSLSLIQIHHFYL